MVGSKPHFTVWKEAGGKDKWGYAVTEQAEQRLVIRRDSYTFLPASLKDII